MNVSRSSLTINSDNVSRTWIFLLFALVFSMSSGISAMEPPNSKTLASVAVLASEQIDGFTVTRINSDLKKPWGMDFLSGDRMLITEKSGSLMLVDLKTGQKTAIAMQKPDIEVFGQGGLLDVAIDPDFDNEPWVYLSYAAGDYSAETKGLYGTEVGRGKLEGNRLVDFKTLFIAQPKTSRSVHFGSRIIFNKTKHLFITLGDRGKRYESQNLSSHLGSVIRLNRDGSVPKDNPFVKTDNALKEIYSYGHRNIQGAIFDSVENQIWTTEHGPQGGDELNIVKPGLNYGWPKITYGKEYGTGRDIGDGVKHATIEPPILQWTPSIAPSGLAIYRGDLFPQWEGQLLAGALKYQLVSRVSFDGKKGIEQTRLFENEFGRIRDISVDTDGAIYLLTDSRAGELIKVTPGKK